MAEGARNEAPNTTDNNESSGKPQLEVSEEGKAQEELDQFTVLQDAPTANLKAVEEEADDTKPSGENEFTMGAPGRGDTFDPNGSVFDDFSLARDNSERVMPS